MILPGVYERGLWIVRNRKPCFVLDRKVVWSDRRYRHYDALSLPLTMDDRRGGHILYWFHFHVGSLDTARGGSRA